MGRIKSLMVKRAAQQLLQKENNFTEKFDDDKKMLGSLMPSKPIRNKIAGYIARLKKAERLRKEAETKPKQSPVMEQPEYTSQAEEVQAVQAVAN